MLESSPLWIPSSDRIENANLTFFIKWLQDYSKYKNSEYVQGLDASGLNNSELHNSDLNKYDALYDWSINNPAAFWEAWADYAQVLFSSNYDHVIDDVNKQPNSKWFFGSTLNYAEHLLRYRNFSSIAFDDAIVFYDENDQRQSMSLEDLDKASAKFAGALKTMGVTVGDCVAAYMPNIIQTVIAMLGTARIGAVWTSCSPDFGVQGVIDRFGQVQPKVLVSVNGYTYAGKSIALNERIQAIQAGIDSIRQVIVYDFLALRDSVEPPPSWLNFQQLLEQSHPFDAFVPVAFNAPLFVMFSSGTTGVPKCIVHGVGGTLLQHLKEHQLHTDIHIGDRVFYYTTCGWMMWNWLVSALASGATLVLYDGSPTYPTTDRLLGLIDKENINVFGTSAKYISELEKSGAQPRFKHSLASLNTILSTGSPLRHESYDYVYNWIKKDVCLSSISGGTDIISCFALGNPLLPVYRGELQCRGLGMDVHVYDASGSSVVGEKGELVCLKSFPSCPIGFLNDLNNQKFHNAYFAQHDNIWTHGDYAEITENGGMIIHGRSDAVLNPNGVRIGTAEIYRQVEKVNEVLESLAIGQEWQGDVRVVLFVKLRQGLPLSENLIQRIKQVIRTITTAHHTPSLIIAVADIPRTVSGKIVELAVRNVVHGLPVNNIEALANPEALECFKNIPELSK
ncbi:MAG: acetoacetate--CoA ligase [Oleibacter sp.]|nr:acetoacetate--CoA ligase [Thalassolituus sp.]